MKLFTLNFLSWLLNFLVEFKKFIFSAIAFFAFSSPMRNEDILQASVNELLITVANHSDNHDILIGDLSWLSLAQE